MTTTQRALPLFDRIRVASPCDVPWDSMRGDDRVRHCDQCDKNVYDLSSLTRAEVERLFDAHAETPCVSYFQRADGTVLLADCPVGLARRRRRWAAFSALAVGTLVSVAGLFASGAAPAAEVTPEPCDNTQAAMRRQDVAEPATATAPTTPPASTTTDRPPMRTAGAPLRRIERKGSPGNHWQ